MSRREGRCDFGRCECERCLGRECVDECLMCTTVEPDDWYQALAELLAERAPA